MVPPFLAYYGADTQNASILLHSYTQCQLYRQVLQLSSGGAWMHIMGPQNQLWSTGNGWAAAGMTRVLATSQIPFRATTQWQCTGRGGGGIDGVH